MLSDGSPKAHTPSIHSAGGRAGPLFENLRLWAYSNWHRCHQRELCSNILDQEKAFNTFECPLGTNEVETIADSVYRFITHNFSIERLNELKSDRAKQSRQKSQANLIYVNGKPWEEGIPKRTYYYRKKNGVDCEREDISREKPWVKLGVGRTKWYGLGKLD